MKKKSLQRFEPVTQRKISFTEREANYTSGQSQQKQKFFYKKAGRVLRGPEIFFFSFVLPAAGAAQQIYRPIPNKKKLFLSFFFPGLYPLAFPPSTPSCSHSRPLPFSRCHSRPLPPPPPVPHYAPPFPYPPSPPPFPVPSSTGVESVEPGTGKGGERADTGMGAHNAGRAGEGEEVGNVNVRRGEPGNGGRRRVEGGNARG